ncbi:MAG: O-acetyl-ADP-ribose deacetylase [Petrimonas sp.]|uniref:O-acetyl-ADP-ribose deacetylase n=1 Tax=bioreactor metagenome TaxID=1076179 RepID=A0A644XX47_9ZZZZ|nr:O-acetyl-ADP-ribose deacetylase [Petrimonas sp.]BBD45525.1 COG2110, Macro domain, possibly ADP-ribosebinding module [Petrimonas sp. IBARAKI]HAC72336.1 O-acetyl-ADP-ribose deacetylase [Porphyromonadaceae bacterium]MDD2911003.1 O-acetyl-ADP-ribose deacetylase [Petrimonas sp.]HBC37996.1 O-acetyl-ADP-ribose deacetylase [Porphyromonadaceae bacterium]
MKIKWVKADITRLEVDAVVNAANSMLLGGGGVDGAIHRAAGPELLEECRTLNGCETGKAKITRGYRLPVKHVIHTVGPVWHGGSRNEESLLKECYVNSLKLADEQGLKSIAFPNISTGVYRFPKERAAEIAVDAVKNFPAKFVEEVTFVCFDEENFEIYKRRLE